MTENIEENIKDLWQTPKDLFNKLDEEFHFDIDAAWSRENCLCDIGFYRGEKDSFETAWYLITRKDHPVIFINPPYSRGNIAKFCKKIVKESRRGCTVVALLPMDCSTKYFHDYILPYAYEIRFLKRRVKYISPETGKPIGSPPFVSIIVVWKSQPRNYLRCSAWDWKEGCD